jgi:8-oxo-dGTP diphosphatase
MVFERARMKRKSRAVGLVCDPQTNCVLLMLRYARGLSFSTLPGGKIEFEEVPEDACVREVLEETGLTVTLKRKLFVMQNLERSEHYFLIDHFSGVVALGGPEKKHQSADNSYDPQWVSIDRLDEVNLLPASIRVVCRNGLQEIKVYAK